MLIDSVSCYDKFKGYPCSGACFEEMGREKSMKLITVIHWAASSEFGTYCMRAAKIQASLRIRPVSPEPPLLAHTNSESRGTFRQKAGSLAPLNGWACAVKICHDGMLEDTKSLDAAHTNNWQT